MSAGARIGAFGLFLAAVFGGALGLGWAVRDDGDSAAAAETETRASGAAHAARGHAGHGGGTPETGGAASATKPGGLSVADAGLRLVLSETTLAAGRAHELAFRITREGGEPLRDYDVEHERRLHLIVVRRDLTQFEHLHPTFDDDTWTVTLPGLLPGAYRAFADFSTRGRKTVLGGDLFVPGGWSPVPLPRASVVSGFAGEYSVELLAGDRVAGRETVLAFDVRGADRRPAPLQPYLGARGHLVILRDGDLAYLHTHADEDSLEFATTFPSAGRYRAFLEFSAGGRVRTAPFTLEVSE